MTEKGTGDSGHPGGGTRVAARAQDATSADDERAPAAPGRPAAGRRPWDIVHAGLLRPEFTAVAGTVVVFVFFAITAGSAGFLTATATQNYLEVAAELGIVATPVTLLLVAGEFDLSVGSMVGAASILFAYPVMYWHWPMLPSILLAMAGACLVGLVNGLIVTRTPVPSFIVTLAMMFILAGVTLAETNALTGSTQITGIQEQLHGDFLLRLFAGEAFGLPASFFWWAGITGLAALVLDRTRAGNWIYATGGDREAAVKTGVPVSRVKLALFVMTAMGATLTAILIVFVGDTADVTAGTDIEFQAAAAAVIGGALITGGYGSPVGTAFGALLFGIVNQGFFYTSINDNWFQAFVGAMLLAAVLVNTYIRHRSAKRLREGVQNDR
jgi:simple sugar transport system permease protein